MTSIAEAPENPLPFNRSHSRKGCRGRRAIRWLRTNLFSSIPSTVISLLLIFLLAQACLGEQKDQQQGNHGRGNRREQVRAQPSDRAAATTALARMRSIEWERIFRRFRDGGHRSALHQRDAR